MKNNSDGARTTVCVAKLLLLAFPLWNHFVNTNQNTILLYYVVGGRRHVQKNGRQSPLKNIIPASNTTKRSHTSDLVLGGYGNIGDAAARASHQNKHLTKTARL